MDTDALLKLTVLIHTLLLLSSHYTGYRIYSINRPGRLLNFWTLIVGAYSRLGAC